LQEVKKRKKKFQKKGEQRKGVGGEGPLGPEINMKGVHAVWGEEKKCRFFGGVWEKNRGIWGRDLAVGVNPSASLRGGKSARKVSPILTKEVQKKVSILRPAVGQIEPFREKRPKEGGQGTYVNQQGLVTR